MTPDTVLLVDLSSLVHALFHVSGKEPDQDWTSQQALARVRAAAHGHKHAAIACEGGRSFRKDLDDSYKGNRPEVNEPLQHQMRLTIEALKADGFPCWSVKGFEADDIVAAATKQALACDGDVLVISDDKDLLQLVGEKVTVKRWRDGELRTPEVVMAKLGVRPDQLLDFLCLVGDTSDNVKGAKGIGGVIAAQLLGTFGSIAELYRAMDGEQAKLKDGVRASLIEFRDRWPKVRELLALRDDVEIPFHEIAVEREVPAMSDLPPMFDTPFEYDPAANGAVKNAPGPVAPPPVQAKIETAFVRSEAPVAGPTAQAQPESAARRDSETNGTAVKVAARQPPPDVLGPVGQQAPSHALVPAPAEWERGLEPRSMSEAKDLATMMFQSRLFAAYGTPQGVLASVLAGRELGLSAMASLRAFHIIENKPCLSADAMRALVLKSGLAEYFRCTERTPERVTFETKRKGEPAPTSLGFTMAEATQSGVVKAGSGWTKFPIDMLSARASAKLSRLVYPDVVAGLYDPSEIS